MTMLQIKNLIVRLRKNKRAVRVALTLLSFSAFVVSASNISTQRKSLILNVFFHGAPSSPLVMYFDNNVEGEQGGKIVILTQLRKCLC